MSKKTIKTRMSLEMMGSDKEFLRSPHAPSWRKTKSSLRIVDLFCGCGGITLGCAIAAHDLGLSLEVPLALDFNPDALACYKANFPSAGARCADISELLQGDWKARLNGDELGLRRDVGRVDMLVGGPPCQGHSDLNNFTRRHDPKNQLMKYMARAAVVFQPKAIVIENVVGSLSDSEGVVHSVEAVFRKLGYEVDVGILDFSEIGVPQRRKRMIMIATLGGEAKVAEIATRYSTSPRTIDWAIRDLADIRGERLVDRIAASQPQTRKRIDYLFDNDLFELPNSQRPPCHRDKDHSYNTVYGRLRWEGVAQTITSGFYSMCMGRYVHPSRRRTLTGREAARLQFFPDFFDFSAAKSRSKLAEIIGNAVPPKGAYAIARSLIPAILSGK
jgi:DNA (cytosine-5)-methyltransferase 1